MDIVASYDAELGSMGRASFTLSGAYDKTTLRSFGTNPAPIAGLGQSVFDTSQQSYLTDAAPKLEVIGGVNWNVGPFSVTARETYYIKTSAIYNDGSGLCTPTRIKSAGITDLEVGYKLTPSLTLPAGANNLFHKNPEAEPYLAAFGETAGGGVIDLPRAGALAATAKQA